MTDLTYYWKKIIELKEGERTGNECGVVFHKGDYMLLEAEQGSKRTNCLDAARFLAGNFEFKDVREIV